MLSYQKFNQRSDQDLPCIVFLHGNSCAASDIEKLAQQVSFPIMSIDLPGHGASKALTSYDLKSMALLVSETINSSTFLSMYKDRGIHLVGHSLGAHVIIYSLLEIDVPIESLTLMGCPPIKPKISFNQFFNTPESSQVLFSNRIDSLLLEKFFNLTGPKENFKEDSSLLQTLERNFKNTHWSFRENFLSYLTSGQLLDEVAILKSFKKNIQFINGSRDALININWIRSVCDELRDFKIEASFDLIEGAGHYPHLTHPREVKNILLENIDSVTEPINYEQKRNIRPTTCYT